MYREALFWKNKFENQKVFAYMVTHDIRNPIQALLEAFNITVEDLKSSQNKLKNL